MLRNGFTNRILLFHFQTLIRLYTDVLIFKKTPKVNTIASSAGVIETPHPYESNKLYMFEVPSPSASQSFTFQFTEFEVSEVFKAFAA